jgi:hypothetical protein
MITITKTNIIFIKYRYPTGETSFTSAINDYKKTQPLNNNNDYDNSSNHSRSSRAITPPSVTTELPRRM